MMNAYTTSKIARSVLAPLMVLALGACTGGEGGEPVPTQELAMAAPVEAAPAPVVKGLGGDPGEPAIGDTIDLRKIGYSRGAAECAAEQEKFWEMHDLLYAKQNEWKANRSPARLFNGYARELGLDESRFASCYREDRGGARTALNNRAADALRVRATPSFFINGRLVEGALPAEQFRQILTTLAGES